MPFPLNFDVYNTTPQRALITACLVLVLLAVIQIRKQNVVPRTLIVATVLSAIVTGGMYIALNALGHTAPVQTLAYTLIPVVVFTIFSLGGSLFKRFWAQATLYLVISALSMAAALGLYLSGNVFDHDIVWMDGPINGALYIACFGSWVFIALLPVMLVARLFKAMNTAWRARKASKTSPPPALIEEEDADD